MIAQIVGPLVTVFGPLATLTVGFAVVSVAWQQKQISHNKLRLDLFDRRYKVFEATRKFLGTIVRDASFQDAPLFEYYVGTSEAEFLFASSVVAYLKQISSRALDMRTRQRHYELLPVGNERTHHVELEHDHLSWLSKQTTEMTAVFTPYLGFSHIR